MKKALKRREFLQVTMTTSLAMSLPASVWATDQPSDIVSLTALQLSEAIKDKTMSCRGVMQAYLAHISRFNPVYNAIVSMPEEDELLRQAEQADAELARGEYRGWMHGMPHAVKDLRASY